MFRVLIGVLLFLAGVAVTVLAATSSGAVPGGTTINLGLLVEKIVMTIVGCTLLGIGAMVWLNGLDRAPPKS